MRTPKHTPDERDRRILRALLVEKTRPAEIARAEGIHRERVRQLLDRLGVRIRPILVIDNPALITELVPEWVAGSPEHAWGGTEQQQLQTAE